MSDVRLIDAEALKKKLDELFESGGYDSGLVMNTIDNAPTVEPTFKPIAEVKFDKEQLQEIVDKAKAEVLASVERPQGDLLSREALIKWIDDSVSKYGHIYSTDTLNMWGLFKDYLINFAPTVEDRPQGEWIPVKYRPMTSEERKAFADYCGIEYCDTFGTETFDCPMPEDGQHVLLSKSWGVVEDVADNDIDGDGFICYGLEENGDWDGVKAWMPMPEPYKKGGAE